MATFKGWGILWPQPLGRLTVGTQAVGASALIVANIFPALRTITVDRIGFYVSAITAEGTVRVGLQQVGSNGHPNGTWLTYADYTVSTTGYHTVTVTGYTVNRGNWVAVCIDILAGSAAFTLVTTTQGTSPVATWSYSDAWNGSSWTKGTAVPHIIPFNATSYETPFPLHAYGNILTYNSGSNPDEVGVRITMPFSCTIIGAWAYVDIDGACNLNVYRPDGTKLSVGLSNNMRQTSNQQYIMGGVTPFSVDADQQVTVSLEPTTTTSIVAYRYSLLNTDVDKYLISGGEYIQGVHRTDAGSWSTNSAPLIGGVVIGEITTQSGGGGISRARVLGGM